MHASFLLFSALHGTLGYWDEILNLLPVVIGAILLVYLYRTSKRRQREEDAAAEKERPPDHESI